MPALELTPAELGEVLGHGELEVVGRIAWSSNATFLARVEAGGAQVPAVYKPRRGERPLWDFPDGTLCRREVAAYELSEFLGWGIVPVTVLRGDGPFGEGMVQHFVDHDPEEHYFTLLEQHVDAFRRFAVFDILANNADRKAGHCLRARADGAVRGVDHGLAFHRQRKLRTVIWDFAGEPVDGELAEGAARAAADSDGALGVRLADLLAPAELAMVGVRAGELLAAGHLPVPDEGYHSVPWPLV